MSQNQSELKRNIEELILIKDNIKQLVINIYKNYQRVLQHCTLGDIWDCEIIDNELVALLKYLEFLSERIGAIYAKLNG